MPSILESAKMSSAAETALNSFNVDTVGTPSTMTALPNLETNNIALHQKPVTKHHLVAFVD